MLEHFFTCPYCWETISMLLDPYMSGEIYVEDCQVCCNPIEVEFEIVDGRILKFEAVKLQ
jgi:transcription elongation factor Elf1